MSRKDRNNMTKQIYNTRGLTIEDIKHILHNKVDYGRVDILLRISILQESLNYEFSRQKKIEQEISYLEKFIARKEKG